ncbi:hypothetical protein ACFXTN_031881 [Malus domestica]
MANSLLPTPESKRLRMRHKISMEYVGFNPWLAKNRLARLSLVHREVVLNDLLMPLPSQIIRKCRWEELKMLWLLVHLHQGHRE